LYFSLTTYPEFTIICGKFRGSFPGPFKKLLISFYITDQAMMRILSLCLLFCISYSLSAQVTSISPAVSNPSQTLSTVIMLSSGVMQATAPSPNQASDIYLVQAGDTIFCDYFDSTQVYPGSGANSDSLWCDFTIPSNAMLGWYEVHVTTYFQDTNPPFDTIPIDNMLGYGMVVADPNACDVPFNTSATAITTTSAQINWDAAVIADTFRVRYREVGTSNYLYKDVDGAGGIVNTTLSNLFPGTDYTYEVSTKCLGYSSTYSIIDNFQTTIAGANCIIPNQLDTFGVTATDATLLWNPLVVSDTFIVRYALNGTSNYLYKTIAGGGANMTTITGLTPARAYKFQVASVCLGVSSGYSANFVFNTLGPCAKPHSLTATNITNSSAEIGWTELVTGDNFRVRYTINGTSNYKYQTVSGSVYSTTITGLLPGTTYNYQVSTMCSGAGTGYSSIASFTTVSSAVSCIKPYGISSSNLTSSTAQINWSVFVEADTFRIRYRLNGAGQYFYKNIDGAGGITNGTITGLLPSSLYTYQVSSICLGVSSGYSSTLNFTTTSGAIVCGVPSGVASSSITSSTALISWNTSVTADTFRLRFAENGTSVYRYKDIAGGGYSTMIDGLSPITTYDVQVSSICSGVSSGYSSVHTFSTIAGTVPCATPYDLNTTSILPNSATISWTPDITADSFMVRYSVLGTTNYVWKKITGAGGVFSTSLTGLTNNTSYQWQVRSICNGVSVSVYSASYSFATPLVRLAKQDPVPAEEHFVLYPNPADEKFFIRFNAVNDETCIFYLVDLAGRIVHREEFTAVTGENIIEIPSQEFAQGIYSGIFDSPSLKKQVRVVIR